MALRRINFTNLPVDDLDRAIAFYQMLGFDVAVDAPYTEDWRWVFMEIPGAPTRLHFTKRAEITVHEGNALMLVCDDVDAEAARLGSAGVTIIGGPADAPWAADGVRWLQITDSEGNTVLLESMKEG